jgi:hypothetical protein
MKRLFSAAAALVALAGLGFWLYGMAFPSPQKVIRQRLVELARTASFGPGESALAKLANCRRLTEFCAEDVEIVIDLPGHSQQTITGRDELLQTVLAARSSLRGLEAEFVDINVNLGPGRKAASANLTSKAKVAGERDLYVQEMSFRLQKVEGAWLIRRIETVRTLR